MSQDELAQATGLSVRSIGKLETGRVAAPRPATVRLLADAFGLVGVERERFCQAAAGEASDRPAVVAVPAQLPPDVRPFVGRDEQLAWLDALVDRSADQATAVVISAIAGTPGVGKTALALRWAHRVRDRFPDGQLYINLQGYAAGSPMPPLDALARLLHTLGVPAEKVPPDVDQAAAVYRSLLAERRTLVLLDNAASADQVRPLLPGGAGSVVLVTSRDQLGGLVARDGAHRMRLDVLAADEAHALLAGILGAGQAASDPDAVRDLAEVCGYLPLALRIAAANLAAHPQRRIADQVARLRDRDRFAALAVPGDPHTSVAAAFELSYTRLPAPARRMFRLLGLVPGPDVTVEGAAALADITVEQATPLLETLTAAHLLDEHTIGRYTCHDLLRRYAADRAGREDAEPERRAALARLYDFYLSTVDAAARLLYAGKLRLPLPDRASAAAAPIGDHAQAMSWLNTELPCLVAAIRHARRHGPRPMAWLLADALRGYFWLSRGIIDWLATGEAALAAAHAEGDLHGQAAIQLSLGDAHVNAGRYDGALERYRDALATAERLGSIDVQSAVLNNAALVYLWLGRPREAADHYRHALALARRMGSRSGEAVVLGNLGNAYRMLGSLQQAVDHHTQALAIHHKEGKPTEGAFVRRELAVDYHMLGEFDLAREHLSEASAELRTLGDRAEEAEVLRCLAALDSDTGAPSTDLAEAAVVLTREIHDRLLEAGALNTLGTIHHRLADHQHAIENHAQALRIAREMRLDYVQAEALIGLGAAYQGQGDRERAHERLDEALAIAERAGFRILQGQALATLAELHLAAGDLDRANEAAGQALTIHYETGSRYGQARAVDDGSPPAAA